MRERTPSPGTSRGWRALACSCAEPRATDMDTARGALLPVLATGVPGSWLRLILFPTLSPINRTWSVENLTATQGTSACNWAAAIAPTWR